MSRAVLSIGSNVGDSLAYLQSVVDDLGDLATDVSAVYATAPWGGVEQQDFLNAVVVVDDPNSDCWAWLARGQRLEVEAERVRIERWGPRSLDVDVVTCTDAVGSDVVNTDPRLIVPHPRAHERAFVLVPWLDVEPSATLGGVPISEHLAALDAAERDGVRRTDLTLSRVGAQ